jgi:hypothetical protein
MSVLVQKPIKTAMHPEEMPVARAFPTACQSGVGLVLLPCRFRVGVSPHTPRRTGTPARWIARRVPVLRGRTDCFNEAPPPWGHVQ